MVDATTAPTTNESFLSSVRARATEIKDRATAEGRSLTVNEVMAITTEDRMALEATIKSMFTELWTETLTRLQEALPFKKGDSSSNERLYNTLRNGILNLGNAKTRRLPQVLEDYIVQQAFTTTTEKHVVAGVGMFNMPRNVRMPSEK